MVFNDDVTYDSMSEGEMEALEQVAMHRQVDNEEEQVFCDEDSSPALVVSKVLTLQHHQEEDQRCHIFHTKADIMADPSRSSSMEGVVITWRVKNYVPSSNCSR